MNISLCKVKVGSFCRKMALIVCSLYELIAIIMQVYFTVVVGHGRANLNNFIGLLLGIVKSLTMYYVL